MVASIVFLWDIISENIIKWVIMKNSQKCLKEQIGICRITARSMRMKRKYYIDNLRWLAILLLFPFHAAQIWSGGEYSGFYIWSHTNTVFYVFSTFVYPWYMTFLFTIAGMSCKYALLKRTNKQLVAERIKKLVIPFFFICLSFL